MLYHCLLCLIYTVMHWILYDLWLFSPFCDTLEKGQCAGRWLHAIEIPGRNTGWGPWSMHLQCTLFLCTWLVSKCSNRKKTNRHIIEYHRIPGLSLLCMNSFSIFCVSFWIFLDLQDQHSSASPPEPGEWQGWCLDGSQIHRWPKGRGPWLTLVISYQCQS